jgi:hypothetical protein
MRSLFLSWIAAGALVGCAQQQPQWMVQPPPPEHPAITGAVHLVSPTDLREVVAIMRTHIRHDYGADLPIYTLDGVSRNHVSVSYWAKGHNTFAQVERVHGKWQLSKRMFERYITTGTSI